ncbi:MAG TPA: DUF4032 domain-containing protein, partial [Propionibacteriaceae bacterium]
VFEPVLAAVPAELRGKLEPAEVYHEVLEHRWFLSEQAGVEVPIIEAADRYVDSVLRQKPDEEVAMSAVDTMGPLANPYDPSQGYADDQASDAPYDPWETGEEPEEEVAGGYLDIAALRARHSTG